MRAPRFTIAGLMGLVVASAVGVAAIRFASELWAGLLLLGTLTILGAAILGVVHRRGARRAWWIGFALFGWGYLFLAFGPWAAEVVAPRLPTTAALDALYAKMHGTDEPQVMTTFTAPSTTISTTSYSVATATPSPAPTMTPSATASIGPAPAPPTTLTFRVALFNAPPEFFRRVGQCLWALLAAVLGGLLSRTFFATSARDRDPAPAPPLA